MNEENVKIVPESIKKRAQIFVPKGQTINSMFDIGVMMRLLALIRIEILQIESTSHRPLCKWQRQSGNSVRAKERDDGRFFLSLSTRTTLERDSLTLRITFSLARLTGFRLTGFRLTCRLYL